MGLRVLLVDDDELALQALTRALAIHQGIEVVTAASEALALPLVNDLVFDAVIADLALEASPRGGLAILHAVRREEHAVGRRRAELLLVTGGEDIAAANIAEALGARFLHKPFPPEALTRLIDRMRARSVDLDEQVARAVALLAEAAGLQVSRDASARRSSSWPRASHPRRFNGGWESAMRRRRATRTGFWPASENASASSC